MLSPFELIKARLKEQVQRHTPLGSEVDTIESVVFFSEEVRVHYIDQHGDMWSCLVPVEALLTAFFDLVMSEGS
ncbi:hypothetical protein SEA_REDWATTLEHOG_146 [Gordonia phage RedWattleHog]|uniref:Uncharacterized protein n=1 Tax=Gordonia phage Stormageddon TaxID=2656541 RepID=A0A649VR75_9CAUD|nr:hypothetical protein KHQ86_gp153 [Gordonia phage Stormageddon]QGJ95007.1 hypothetical protein SEA_STORMAGEDDON_147 [Gordonia phage Stormageddon]QLF83649.1 hypothetical protein SEA_REDWATTLEHOG_146 [Gordonia phage RedWattleHog]